MKADIELAHSALTAKSLLFVGRFVRRQGQYGTIAVVGRVVGDKIETIDDPKRQFPRDGLVETHGLIHHAGISPGDWVEFDIARNTRPRAPEFKAMHLRRLARYAVLPEATLADYRVLLTSEGWRGDGRPGLWALRIPGDKVLVVELAVGKDGALRIPRAAARKVTWCEYDDDSVVSLHEGSATEKVFMAGPDCAVGSFDWSDEADHIARVIRSLSDANDPRVDDIITWLDLHHEEGTGRVFAATVNHEAALGSLRSGELADRLRADRELMKAYLDAALQDEAVRDVVAAYARQGDTAERIRLREEFESEMVEERARRTAALIDEMEREKGTATEKLKHELAELSKAQHQVWERREREAQDELAARLAALQDEFERRRALLDEEMASQESALAATRAETQAAERELEQVRSDLNFDRSRLSEAKAEIDRLLAIVEQLGRAEAPPFIPPTMTMARGVGLIFPERATTAVGAKGELIGRQVLLTNKGKDLLRALVILLLSGELPILTGREVHDFLQLAAALICPGRFAGIEADPTLISVDDLWSRPGSGVPTVMASAALAAESGAAVLVAIKGIERSGARFWVPALAQTLQGGGLPRGLLACCVVDERDHDEISALPKGLPWLEVDDVFVKGASSAAPTLLTYPQLDLEALNPGPMPNDLSEANSIVFELGFEPSLGQAMRVARMFVEAKALLGNDGDARRIVVELARSTMGDAV